MQQQANIPIFTANTGVFRRGVGHYHLDEWHEPDWQRVRTVRRDHDRGFTTSFLILSQLVSAANLDTVQAVVVFHKRVGCCTNTNTQNHRHRHL